MQQIEGGQSESNSQNSAHKEKSPHTGETLLIFGQGPVISLKTSEIPIPGSPPEDVTINYLSRNLARAAAELKKLDPSIQQLTVMGGPTGGDQYASEAHLIAEEMKKKGVDQDAIKLEEKSRDTIENIVNFLNLYDTDTKSEQEYSILCASYHTFRVEILMKLFGVKIKNKYSSEEVLRYVARTTPDESNPSILVPTEDSSKWDQSLLGTLEAELDINNPTRYTSKLKGKQRNIADRYLKEDLLVRELIEFPEKWLPYVGELKNNRRVEAILQQTARVYPNMLQEKYGIQENDDLETKKTKIQKWQHTPLSDETMQKWAKNNRDGEWPKKVTDSLKELTGVQLAKIEKQND